MPLPCHYAAISPPLIFHFDAISIFSLIFIIFAAIIIDFTPLFRRYFVLIAIIDAIFMPCHYVFRHAIISIFAIISFRCFHFSFLILFHAIFADAFRF
jgi:hypothetical protein